MRRSAGFSIAGLLVVLGVANSCGDSTAPERPGPPTDIRISAGNAQTGGAASTLAAPIAAKVTDAKGRGVPNVEVLFQAMDNSGTVNPPSSRTNGAGIATTSWTMPQYAGSDARVRAVLVDTLTGALVDSVMFSAKVVGGTPAAINQNFYATLAATGGRAGPLTVTLFDRFYNRSPNATVTWTVTAGGGTLSAPTSVSDSMGNASIYLTLGTTPGPNTVRASIGTLAAVFTIEGREAGKPELIQPRSYPSAAPVLGMVPLGAEVRDGLGQVVAGVTVTWTVLEGSGSLSTSTSVTNAEGVASTQFTLGDQTTQYTVEARVGALRTLFTIRGRVVTQRLAYVDGAAYGLARTSGGTFVVAIIDRGMVETFQEGSPTIKTKITTGGTPVVVAVDNAGQFAYVSNMGGWMDIINVTTNTVVKQVAVPNAHSLALSPSGDRVFVASSAGKVYAVSTSSREIVDSVDVPGGPWGFAFRQTTSSSMMYVTSRDGASVTEIDLNTFLPTRKMTIGGRPHGLVISPDGRTLYAADNYEGRVKAIDIASGAVTSFASTNGSFGIGISPDGQVLFVTSDYGSTFVVSTSSMTVLKTLDTDGNARLVFVAPDGTKAWAGNQSGWVDIIPR